METSKDANDQDMKEDTEALYDSLAYVQQSHGKIQETEWGRAMFKEIMANFFPRISKTIHRFKWFSTYWQEFKF